MTQKAGPNLMAMITCGRRSSLPPKSSDGVALEVDRYQGLAAFNPVSWTERQIAHWAENTRYRRNPFYQKGLTDSEVLRNLVIQAHPALRRQPMRIPWSTAIILAVLPYAARTITVVAPHGFVIDRVVLEQARRRNISVRKVPIDSFTRDELNQLASGYMIPGTALNTTGNYPRWVEETIGQSQSDNLDLVPQWVRDFGRNRSGNGGT